MVTTIRVFGLYVLILLVGLVFAFPIGILNAQENDVEFQIANIEAQIAIKLSEIETLRRQLSALKEETVGLRKDARELRSQLREGAQGVEVTTLQEWLSELQDVYPEGLVTGYFGPLTKRAVMKFQEKYGLEQVGEVGPQTRGQLHALFFFTGSGQTGNSIDDEREGNSTDDEWVADSTDDEWEGGVTDDENDFEDFEDEESVNRGDDEEAFDDNFDDFVDEEAI
jgi:peptidoglycan hydrolase-like protein with peptidoglycan-binding domain